MPDAVSGPLIVPSSLVVGTTTLADMRQCVRRGIRDDDRQMVPTADVDFWLNEGYLDLCSRLRLVQTEFSGTTTSTGTIPFPADYVETVHLEIGTTPLQEATDDVFESYQQFNGTPAVTLYRYFGTNIETYPVKASAAYTIRYVGKPTKLINDADAFTSLPSELEVRLCRYARAQAHYILGDTSDADREMEVYSRGLPDYPRAMNRRGIGPNQLVPQQSYFDNPDAWE
jgi:hypothetical protein